MTQENIINKIKKYETIIIHRHVRPDPDALGSQVGLKKLLENSFPSKKIYAVGEEDPSFSFLAKMDEISDETYEQALVIVCDTANTARISDQRYQTGSCLIKIDHHPNNDPYGDLSWVDTEASSTSELIFELFKSESELKLNNEAARLIYAGIVGDTGRFLFPSTTDKTFRYAAELVTYKFDRTKLYNSMYDVRVNIAHMKGFVLQNFEFLTSGLGVIKITKEVMDKFNVKPSETSSLVGALGDISGIKAWIFFIEEDEIIRARVRSKGPIINEIASKYNGGGHPLASGASVKSWEEAEKIIADLEKVCLAYIK